ncbi:MAG: hypothetical protein IJ638_02775 [Alphaproteobacteria bacterium]|nr:hypothetical protein [Alphaproteobacteria bacterium]
MRVLSKKSFKKAVGGAVMFQVLLGLGLMVMMSPMIFSQIKKYNEEVQREEAVHDLEKWQKAASSYIVFEKDKGLKTGVTTGSALKSLLSDYLGGDAPKTTNGFGQTYGMVIVQNAEKNKTSVDASGHTVVDASYGGTVESVVFAYGGGVDKLTLNGIGQFLFDKGAVMDSDGTILSDLSLSSSLTNALRSYVSPAGGGLLFMFVTDSFFSSDYLHVAPMPGDVERGSLVNTMIVDLNMNSHSMNYVKNLYTNKLSGANIIAGDLSVSSLTLNGKSEVSGDVLFNNSKELTSATEGFPFKTIAGTDGHTVEVDDLTIGGDLKLHKIYAEDVDLNTKTVSAKGYYVHGNTTGVGTSVATVVSNTFVSDGSKADTVGTLTLDAPTTTSTGMEDSYIYIGNYTTVNGNKVYNEGDSIILNLAGTSEVSDICKTDGTCLSDKIANFYDTLMAQLTRYMENR